MATVTARLRTAATRLKPVDQVLRHEHGEVQLRKVLAWYDLLGLGVGSIIGAGLFVLTGIAARRDAGPSIVLSYLFSGVACVFSGLCYAEFAARIPVAGSAYVYAYCTLGEFTAWLVGWNLILEYVVAVAAVARGWSSYLATLLAGFALEYPKALYQIEFNCANVTLVEDGSATERTEIACNTIDLTAFVVTVALTVLTAVGTKSSSMVNGIMMGVTFLTIFFVIFAGAAFVNPVNWSDFFPFGFQGTIRGAAVIFFSYVGFDSVSTFAEETKSPKRDMPIGVVGSILISTALYCAVALVITGMVPYYEIDLDAPLAAAFAVHGLPWAQVLVSLGAFLALTTTIITSLMSMPRIFLAMSRDGLFFPVFKYISPRFNTPIYGALITGGVAAVLTLAIDIELLADMVSIGTLFAFYIVCAAIIILRLRTPARPSRGTLFVFVLTASLVPPLVASTYNTPVAALVLLWLLPVAPVVLIFREPHVALMPDIFVTPFVPLTPILGMTANLYLMVNLGALTWLRLVVWIIVGVLIYAFYGMPHSKLGLTGSVGQDSVMLNVASGSRAYAQLKDDSTVDSDAPADGDNDLRKGNGGEDGQRDKAGEVGSDDDDDDLAAAYSSSLPVTSRHHRL